MRINLLDAPHCASTGGTVDTRLLYQLSLDRAFAFVCPDVNKRERFFSVVTRLTAERESVVYRQDILRDLMRYPALLEQMRSLNERMSELARAQRTAGRDAMRLRADGTDSPEAAKNVLQAQALCLKRALLFVKGFAELLAPYELQAEGLRHFREVCRSLCESPSFAEMVALCGRYEDLRASGFLDFRFVLSAEGRVTTYELIDHRYIHVTDPEWKRKGFSLFRRDAGETYPCERITVRKGESYESLASAALASVTEVISAVSGQLFGMFSDLGLACDFYYVALSYIRKLNEIGAPSMFPTLDARVPTQVRGLRDVYLLLSVGDARTVVPNDLTMTRSLAVFGDNGSGKTVYLRALGSMQLLAQAGLPIPAEQATLVPCTQIAAQFSQAETEFCEGNDAGRFEQEVRELAAMVETLHEGALVLLNETFQSTAYSEGAQGLYAVLEHFSACGIRWVLVSHLRELESMLCAEQADIRHTAQGFRIE